MTKLDDIYQDREFKSLDDIFANDSLGIFDNVKAISKKTTSGSLLQNQFIEINSFIDSHGRLPSDSSDDLNEKILLRRLTSIRSDSAMVKELIAFDRHNVLNNTNEKSNLPAGYSTSSKAGSDSTVDEINHNSAEISGDTSALEPLSFNSFDDIFDSDDLGIFDDVQPDILISGSQSDSRAMRDRYEDEDIASRFQCEDFYKFEEIFESIYSAIQSGAFTKSTTVSPKSINVGSTFVLNGQLCYIADIYKAEARKDSRSQERLRLIFANGTESNMLTHSLVTAQYKYDNSYQLMITDPDWVDGEFAKNFNEYKYLTGVIYVAKLVTPPSNLTHYRNLHKIGFSTLTGEVRTKHSIKDTAFLQQEVNVIAEWQIYDANARSVEGVLHAFFHNQRVKVSLMGSDDKIYKANEWFDVPLAEIEKSINLVIAGNIKGYRMDAAGNEIVAI